MKRLFNRLKLLVTRALRQGWSVDQVCLSAAWGMSWGLFPIYGITTLVLMGMGAGFKLNHSVLQGFNYLMGPLKLLLILPYIRLGEWVFRAQQPFSLSLGEFTRRFQAAPLPTLGEFALTFLHAIGGWLITLPLLFGLTYALMRALLRGGEAARLRLKELSS